MNPNVIQNLFFKSFSLILSAVPVAREKTKVHGAFYPTKCELLSRNDLSIIQQSALRNDRLFATGPLYLLTGTGHRKPNIISSNKAAEVKRLFIINKEQAEKLKIDLPKKNKPTGNGIKLLLENPITLDSQGNFKRNPIGCVVSIPRIVNLRL